MPDGDVARHGGESLFVEDLTDESEILEDQYLRPVGNGDTRRLLSPMLECVKTVVSELGHILARRPDPENTTFFSRFVLILGKRLSGHNQTAP